MSHIPLNNSQGTIMIGKLITVKGFHEQEILNKSMASDCFFVYYDHIR